MIKILNASQIQEADRYSIAAEQIQSFELMERASNAFVSKFIEIFQKKEVYIFAGTGNNGGDALAIGRLLLEKDWNVKTYIVGEVLKGSRDFKANLKRLREHIHISASSDFPLLREGEIVVDGMFGSGLARSIKGIGEEVINFLNNQEVNRVAIDIPSGLFLDKKTDEGTAIFKADHTISFQLPKLAFFLPEAFKYVGQWHVVNIGLDLGFISKKRTDYFFSEAEDMMSLLPLRSRFAHKTQLGKLLVAAGSRGKMGAAALCAKSALRAGVGLINVNVPKTGVNIIQTLVPEAMVVPDKNENVLSAIESSDSTFAIGPGIGTDPTTVMALANFLKKIENPLVLDADAINIIAANNDLLEDIPNESIMTPHPGEFRRLVGDWDNDFEKLDFLREFSMSHNVNVVLKGAFSAVCNTNGEIFFNPSGNPGMATAGSGDVLTGIVSSFLAQGIEPFDALKLGVFTHGLAGDLAAEIVGEASLIASDIIDQIPNALKKVGMLGR